MQAIPEPREGLVSEGQSSTRGDFAPCPLCKQYSHSIGEDRLTDAFKHFQSMYAHPVRGHPMGNNFDEKTRDAAQVLMASARTVSPSPEQSGELVSKLRARMENIYDFATQGAEWQHDPLCQQAADALESAQAEIAELRSERDALLQKPIDLSKLDSIDEGAGEKMVAYYWWEQAQDARSEMARLTEALDTFEREYLPSGLRETPEWQAIRRSIK
jgi:hypothetical protein